MTASPSPDTTIGNVDWRPLVKRFHTPSVRMATYQILTGPVAFLALFAAAMWGSTVHWGLAGLFCVAAAGFYLRTFIIFHDCTHGSFVRSKRANAVIGSILGVLLFTPFYHWRRQHAVHHATSGDLDHRGVGDIWTLTVDEYNAAPWTTRLGYRLFRHPLVMFGIGPAYIFILSHRYPFGVVGPRERKSVHLTNLALLVIAAGLWSFGLLSQALLVFAPMFLISGAIGIWMFYVQHDFDGTTWTHNEQWDFAEQALHGSSFYKLPRVLQWFSGNIGFHHIHHLSPKIPNYRLEKCQNETPLFQSVEPLTLWASLRCARLRLWCEERQRLVTFREAKRRPAPS